MTTLIDDHGLPLIAIGEPMTFDDEGTLVETALSRELRAAVGAAMQEFQDTTFIDEANHRYHCGGSSCADRLTPIFAKHGIGLLADYRASLAAEVWAEIQPGNEHGLTYQAGRTDGLRAILRLIEEGK